MSIQAANRKPNIILLDMVIIQLICAALLMIAAWLLADHIIKPVIKIASAAEAFTKNTGMNLYPGHDFDSSLSRIYFHTGIQRPRRDWHSSKIS